LPARFDPATFGRARAGRQGMILLASTGCALIELAHAESMPGCPAKPHAGASPSHGLPP